VGINYQSCQETWLLLRNFHKSLTTASKTCSKYQANCHSWHFRFAFFSLQILMSWNLEWKIMWNLETTASLRSLWYFTLQLNSYIVYPSPHHHRHHYHHNQTVTYGHFFVIKSNSVGNVRHRRRQNLLKRLGEVEEIGKISMGIARVSLKLHPATECVARHRKKRTNNFGQLLNSRYEIISGNKSWRQYVAVPQAPNLYTEITTVKDISSLKYTELWFLPPK
jgi:hypothetical protein